MTDTNVAERPANPVAIFRQQVESRQQEFAAALPAHIPAERFARVILTAVNKNPALLSADRASLFSSAMMAAADGLLCDGREAALVIYRTKKKDANGDYWIDAVQYMPMVGGILKKCRNSGELSSIVARVVYAGDNFRNWIDDKGEHLEYEAGDNQDRDVVRCAFAMAKLKDGSIEVEVLKPLDIEKIRSISRSKDKGPWVDWWEEMAKKSAIRRLSKRLPLNTDLDDLIRRDDNLYDFNAARSPTATMDQVKTLAGKLDALAGLSPPIAEQTDPETGEITQTQSETAATPAPLHAAASEAGAPPSAPATNQTSSTQTDVTNVKLAASDAAGQAAGASDPPVATTPAATVPKEAFTSLPKTEKEYFAFAATWINQLTDIDEGEQRWKHEKNLRNKSNVGAESREELQERLAQKCREIRDADRS
jgi:recombination protein RecT